MDEYSINQETSIPTSALTFNRRLNLKPWNEALAPKISNTIRESTPSKSPWKLSGPSQREPVQKSKVPIKTPINTSQASGKRLKSLPITNEAPNAVALKSSIIATLPNASKAEYWLRKANHSIDGGNMKEARQILKDGIQRKAYPLETLQLALANLETPLSSTDNQSEMPKKLFVTPNHHAQRCKSALKDTGHKTTTKDVKHISFANSENVQKKFPKTIYSTPHPSSQFKGAGVSPTTLVSGDEDQSPFQVPTRVNKISDCAENSDEIPKCDFSFVAMTPNDNVNLCLPHEEINLCDNELFNCTPSPSPNQVNQAYTPSSKLLHSNAKRSMENGLKIESTQSPEILSFYERLKLNDTTEKNTDEFSFSTQTTFERTNDDAGKYVCNSTPMRLSKASTDEEPSSLCKPSRVLMRPRVGKNEMKAVQEVDSDVAMGSMSTLSPVRTPHHLKSKLGANEVVLTPVRRSVRKSTKRTSPRSQLEKANFAYIPNPALGSRLQAGKSLDFETDGKIVQQMANLTIEVENAKSGSESSKQENATDCGYVLTNIKPLKISSCPIASPSPSPMSDTCPASHSGVLSPSPISTPSPSENNPLSLNDQAAASGFNTPGKPRKKDLSGVVLRKMGTSRRSSISLSPTEQDIRSTLRQNAKDS